MLAQGGGLNAASLIAPHEYRFPICLYRMNSWRVANLKNDREKVFQSFELCKRKLLPRLLLSVLG